MLPFDYGPASEMPTDAKPDAIMCPNDYPSKKGEPDVLLHLEFKAVFGCSPAIGRYAHHFRFLTPSKGPIGQTAQFGYGHPTQLEPRYTWYKRNNDEADQVYYGFKVNGADLPYEWVAPTPTEAVVATVAPPLPFPHSSTN